MREVHHRLQIGKISQTRFFDFFTYEGKTKEITTVTVASISLPCNHDPA